MINDLLFVYGTLLSADNEFAHYLKSNSTFYSDGKIKGRLYDMGEYPGVITGTNDDYEIKGGIFCLSSPEALKVIDDYEGFGEDHQPNLYLRELLSVQTVNGPIDCWVYIYNLSVDGLVEIKTGDYLGYRDSI